MHRRLADCSLISFVAELREASVLAIADLRTISEGEWKKTSGAEVLHCDLSLCRLPGFDTDYASVLQKCLLL